MVLFRDIRQGQEVGERSRDRNGILHRHRPQKISKLVDVLPALLPPRLREGPHAFDGVQQIFSGALAQRLTKDVAEEVHIVTQRLVGIERHFPIIDMLLRVVRTDDAERLAG